MYVCMYAKYVCCVSSYVGAQSAHEAIVGRVASVLIIKCQQQQIQLCNFIN